MNAKTLEGYARLMNRHGLARLKVSSEGVDVEIVAGRAPVPVADEPEHDVEPPPEEAPEDKQARLLKLLLASSGGVG